MLSVLFVVLAASLAAPHASLSREALLKSPTRHVRAANADIQRLLASGIDRSPTFHAMMARLEGTDVIVYIEPVPMLPGTIVGRLVMLPYGGSQRYLRIQVTFGQSSADTIALIGHELRHALEIADARNVVDEKDLIALYRRIGDRAREGLHQYDTAAARSIGQRVSRELA